MKSKNQGVALIMVLVVLLLMTLISATAIKQNSLQFAMVGNVQEQSQSFAHAENILKLVQEEIDSRRWSTERTGNAAGNNDSWRCKSAGGNYSLIEPGTTINLGIAGSTAVVQSWWCENNPDTTQAVIDQDGDGVVEDGEGGDDVGHGQPASCAIGEECPSIPTHGFAPFPSPMPSEDYNPIGCGTELYTIRVTFAQQNASNAERAVEARYAVRCQRPPG